MGQIFGTINLPHRSTPYATINQDVEFEADVCIVGSGAAGAVLAYELVKAGKKVALIERGGYYEGQDMNQNDMNMMPLLWKNSGAQFDDELRIAIAQGSCLGGSTVINDAVCFDLPSNILDEWRTDHGVNFTDDEVSRYTNQVNSQLNVSVVTDDELNENNLRLQRAANALGYTQHQKNSRNCKNCMQCGFCHLGCHYETKQDVFQGYLKHAVLEPTFDLTVFCNCYVEKIIYANSKVEGIEGSLRDDAENELYKLKIKSDIVIISAGAIASSKLLLTNNISVNTAGKGLCLHPAPYVLGDFEEEVKSNQGIPMAYTVHEFGVSRDSTLQISDGYDGAPFLIESIFLPLMQFSMGLPGDLVTHSKLLRRYNHYTMAGIVVRDGNNGQVKIANSGRTSISYDLGSDELKAVAKGIEQVAKMWFAIGAKQIVVPFVNRPVVSDPQDIPDLIQDIMNNPKQVKLGSAHPQSGNAIGLDPANSVVDPNCKVHGFDNLYVCDASVFPTSVGVNPQISVMTVASIIAERLINNWS